MTKESILFERLGVYSFDLKTKTLRTGDKKITTYYWVIWYCKHGGSSEIKQEITKEEYEFLLKELGNDR
ncbi:MAG: hypothetical protein J6V66_00685 [Clostridia bacterium]|nr:hypothetical protein [Clostridia bacterium]